MPVSKFTMENPKIPIKKSINRFLTINGILGQGWKLLDEDHLYQLTDTSESGIFYQARVNVGNYYILDFVALVCNDSEAILLMDAISIATYTQFIADEKMDKHMRNSPHFGGM